MALRLQQWAAPVIVAGTVGEAGAVGTEAGFSVGSRTSGGAGLVPEGKQWREGSGCHREGSTRARRITARLQARGTATRGVCRAGVNALSLQLASRGAAANPIGRAEVTLLAWLQNTVATSALEVGVAGRPRPNAVGHVGADLTGIRARERELTVAVVPVERKQDKRGQ